MTEPPPPARRGLAVAVGLFALWQLVFLPAANLIDFVPRRPAPSDVDPVMDMYQVRGTFTSFEPLQRTAELAGDALDFWSEVTGQDQGWMLFAGGNPPYSLFQAVELHFAYGEVVEIRSRFEPTDLRNPAPRAPLVHDRFFNFEAQFPNPGWYCSPESVERFPEVWSRELPKAARDGCPQILVWLRWHVAEYRKAHPERGTPTVVVLKHRYIRTPLPGEPREWTKPIEERPYCRWRPGETPEPGYLPIEGYDPVAKRFVRLREAAP
jgi:hypothetical protein